jgi:hypothetical protein
MRADLRRDFSGEHRPTRSNASSAQFTPEFDPIGVPISRQIRGATNRAAFFERRIT